MGVTMETRNKGKRTQRRAHRDDGVELLARPRNIGRPPCPSSIPRFFFGNAKLRPKPLGKKLKLLSTQKVEGTHKSSAPHLFGSLLLKVRRKSLWKNGWKSQGFHYFLDPKSKAARLGYSTLTIRKRTGHAIDDSINEKECGTESGAAATCSMCPVKVGDTYFGVPVTACMFVIDHPTDKVDSWMVSRKKGTTAAHLKAGVAWILCAFCNADKSPADSVKYTPL
jgi:hypothetical protein